MEDKMTNANDIIISIVCTTFNHEKYIAQALDGFIIQQTSFPFEIIVHDDASTDNTAQIIREYELKYPDLFVSIYQSENQYSKKDVNIWTDITFPKARGKYIAICEGDDYWTDPYKLQKQVDFLEKNTDYNLVYSLAKVYIEKKNQFQKKPFGKAISSFEELLLENSISTPTVLFRKEGYLDYAKEIKPKEKDWLMGDYPLWLYLTSTSRIKCLNYPSSVYRVLENSAAHSSNPSKELLFLESYHAIKLYYLEKLKCSPLNKEIWGRYFSNKAYIYLLKSEQNIDDLIYEINKSNIRSLKIRIIKLIISNLALRKILKLYWSNK